MIIAAHGSTVTVSRDTVTVHRDPLLAALHGPGPEIPLASVTGVSATPGDPVTCGLVVLEGPGTEIVFSPNQDTELEQFTTALEAALNGDAPTVTVPGLNFTAVHVDHDPAWDTVDAIGVARVRDGVVVDGTGWTGTGDTAPLDGFLDYIGDDGEILVAHNAYRQITALHRAIRGSGATRLPDLPLGCTLALARRERPHDDDHSLLGLCRALGLREPDSPAAAAEVTARLLVLLNGDTTRDTVTGILAGSGLTPGRSGGERVWPVLDTVPEPPAQPAPSRRGGERGKTGRPVPWAKVAVPDTVPEPNPDADRDGLLYGQNVTLSGDFGPFDKGQLWQRIADAGATVGKNVTRKTTVLVCGEWGKPTSKQKRAEELMEKGQDIALWSAEQLYTTLGLDPAEEEDVQPPF
ncbi:hypothetical protein OS125_02330 [Corynebacterium sp. P7003]|uniref:DNA polymerase III subunit epsilon n=1 Tax=Corynebacterium pygosceleis TaxID=2800406 RepID=A0ABT3WQK4_9CORY|nr:hypothetical protein [Corynebacterium pygosceleis]MCX7444083.1 hypothetical protein [Corynebacterium pygosceleis]